VATKESSRLPAFRYVGPSLHRGSSTLFIGDAVHTVKPYFGLGANSALEDVIKLSKSIDAHTTKGEGVRGAGVAAAIQEYSVQRGPEARALVQISREFDRPGILGFVTFILPLILDGLFNGLAPKIFSPNTIAMLQRDGLSFRNVRNIKRRDRVLQLMTLAAVVLVLKTVLDLILKFVPRQVTLVGLGLAAVVVGARKFGFFLRPNTSPADVLAKTSQTISDKDTISKT